MPFDPNKPYDEYRVDRLAYRYKQDGKFYLANGQECHWNGLSKDKSAIRYEDGETMKRRTVRGLKWTPGRFRNKRGNP